MSNQPKSPLKSRKDIRRSRFDFGLYLIMPENVEDEARILKTEFFKTSRPKLIIFWILSVLSLGVIPMICICKISIRMLFKYVVAFPAQAESLLIHGYDGTTEHIQIFDTVLYLDGEEKSYKCFTYRFYNFYFDETTNLFKPCQFSLQGKTYKSIHKEIGIGMASMEVYRQRYLTYGRNATNLPPVSNLKLIANEVLSPLNISQVYAMIIWSLNVYYLIYASVILFLAVLTTIINFIRTKANYEAFRKKASYETEIRVYRPAEEEGGLLRQIPKIVNSTQLVPGDLVEISPGIKMPCDIILLRGTCKMNESMLTGEALFVIKEALPQTNEKFNIWSSDQHLLFAGTECLETIKAEADQQVLGIVIRTGFWTMKTRFLRSYLYSKTNNHQLVRDIFRFVGCFAIIPLLCFLSSVKLFVSNDEENREIIFNFFNIINVAIPPMLPTLILIITFVSSLRLERNKIVSKSEMKINLAGKVDIVCFDKTGTLTKDCFDIHGIRPVLSSAEGNAKFDFVISSEFHENLSVPTAPQSHHLLLQLMATCNNVTYTHQEYSGDPLDIKILQSIGWSLKQTAKHKKYLYLMKPPHNNVQNDSCQNLSVEVIQRFEFNTKLQRSSVICQSSSEDKQRIFVKGSPYAIQELCRPGSVPKDFDEVFLQYEQRGYHVIACATQVLMDKVKVKTSDNLWRNYFEQDLQFLGFLIYENKINDETSETIEKLTAANISSIMLTGDKPSSSFFVASQAGIIKSKQKVILGALRQIVPGTDIANLEWSWLSDEGNSGCQTENEILHLKEIMIEIDEAVKLQIPDSPNKERERSQIIKAIENDKDATIVLTGEAFKLLAATSSANFAFYLNVLKKTKVYSQMKPDNKARVIKELQRQGHIVAMCGDGLNDYPPLRAAAISVAIGDAEASFASSFASKSLNISRLDILLREGRSSLVTTFQCFKYMSMYSLIQTFIVIILYSNSTQLSGACFMFQDLLVTLPSAIAISFTRPANKLSEQSPPGTLMSIRMLFCIVGHALIQSCLQLASLHALQKQSWYKSPSDLLELSLDQINNFHSRMKIHTYESTTIFLVSSMQILTMVIAFSVGKPFRQSIHKNLPLMIAIFASGAMIITLTLSSSPSLIHLFRIRDFDSQDFRWMLFGIIAANSLVSIIYEKYVVDTLIKILPKFGFIKRHQ